MEYQARFQELTSKPVMEQANAYLEAFVLDFKGNFEEVLELGTEFMSYGKGEDIVDLEEIDAHYFLEKRGEATTVKELRDMLKIIDLDNNKKMAFIEYLLFKYGKSLEELFNPPGEAPPELIALLNEAIAQYKAVQEEKAVRDRQIAELQKIANKGGVKGMAAKREIDQIVKADESARNKAEITAAARQRIAAKLVKNADGSEIRKKAMQEEQRRLDKEAKEKAEAEAKEIAARKARLRARAARFE